ncbi:hypothetical protein ABW636_20745 [Aquimarina sp. 2201CG1-2-11]|uniref:hypothetical protein n=1 Tax=Aquimarina discodermiae TaxID=3231043 RepID=UPI003463596E
MILILSERLDESTNDVMDWILGTESSVIRANAYDLQIENIDINKHEIFLKYKKDYQLR